MANVIESKKGEKNAKGISLIELSIVLTISGMILVPLLIMAQIYMEQYRQEKLLRLEKIVHNTMKAYMQRYNRYPCPALRPTETNPAAFGDGVENCADAQTIDGARTAWSTSDDNNVMVGVFPEYTMESGQRVYLKSFIPPDEPIVRDFIDPWGGRLTYFVTKGLTDSSKFNSANGTVAVVDENGNPTDGINKDALYALVSHGSDQAGAVNVNGIVTSPCPDESEHELENPNCGSGSMVNAPVVSGLIRKGAGVRSVVDNGAGTIKNIHDYYNDHVFSRRFYEKDLWIPLPEGNNARVNLYTQTGKNIGVGISNPQEVLDLVGPPSATGGNIRIDRALVMGFKQYTSNSSDKDKTGLICTTKDDDDDGVIDENSNNQLDDSELTCVNPITFFNMKCPAGKYMKEIRIDANYNLVTTCEEFRVTPPGTGNAPQCPSNKVIRGIYSNGDIMCASGETSDNGSNHSWE